MRNRAAVSNKWRKDVGFLTVHSKLEEGKNIMIEKASPRESVAQMSVQKVKRNFLLSKGIQRE